MSDRKAGPHCVGTSELKKTPPLMIGFTRVVQAISKLTNEGGSVRKIAELRNILKRMKRMRETQTTPLGTGSIGS